MNLTELNQAWQDFVESQRLFIMMELEEPSLHFLENIKFENPLYRKTKNFMEHRVDVRYVGEEISVAPDFACFNLGLFEYEMETEVFVSEWEIDSTRTEKNFSSYGDDVDYYLESYNISNEDASKIENFFFLFELREKIERAHVSEKRMINHDKNQALIEKYHDKPVQIVEKDGNLFIVLHDGEKVQFTYN